MQLAVPMTGNWLNVLCSTWAFRSGRPASTTPRPVVKSSSSGNNDTKPQRVIRAAR